MKLLIVEDNRELLASIIAVLVAENFRCEQSSSFREAEDKIHMYAYDVLVIDINLPDGSGLELIRQVKRQQPHSGIIVISARNATTDKISGLDLGADDYVTKPFELAELVARIKALIRRRQFHGDAIIQFGNIQMNITSRTIHIEGQPVDLTKSEFDILLFFFSNPRRVLTRESIAEHIWGDNMDLADSFDFIYSHIKNLRKKLKAMDGDDPIKAVYGVGYRLDPALSA